MKRFLTLTLGAFVAFTVAATTISTQANAGKRDRRIAAGVILGAIGGAIIAGEIHRNKKKRRARRHYNQQRYYNQNRNYGNQRYYNQRRNYGQQRYYQPRVRYGSHYNQPRVRYNRRRHQRRVYNAPRLSRYERHVRNCYASYRTYDQRSDTFIGYDGREHVCRK